jgi:uncharacterized RDD family membrane protein YckC
MLMKCKRCRAIVPDDIEVCPQCGQDLSSLRKLLSDFYNEEPIRPEEQDLPAPEPEVFPTTNPKEKSAGAEDIRVVMGPVPGDDRGYSFPEEPSLEEPEEEEKTTSTWDRALRGGFWLRLMAFAIDQVILLLLLTIFVVLGFVTLSMGTYGGREIPILRQIRIVLPVILPLGVALHLAYFTFFHGTWGQTVGKMIFGLRVVGTDGQPLTFSGALGRSLGYILSAIPFCLGFIWAGFTSGKRSWHDLLVDTMVIREQ